MNPNPQPPYGNPWLGRIGIALLCAQLGLLWIQGSLLHRQHQDLQGLREDVQTLTESLEQGSMEEYQEEGHLSPARHIPKRPRAWRFQRVIFIAPQEEAPDPAAKELEESKRSAQKAVKDAREVQGKLSISENARKAEEKAKLQEAQHSTTTWFLIATGVGILALVGRGWLRRRG